jgi:hypothetical protein
MLIGLFLLVPGALATVPLPVASEQRQLFIDTALVSSSEGAMLRMHQPIKGDVVITPDR